MNFIITAATTSVTVSDFCIFLLWLRNATHAFYIHQHLSYTEIQRFFHDHSKCCLSLHIGYTLFSLWFSTLRPNLFSQTSRRFVYPFVFTRSRASSASSRLRKSRNKPPPTVNFEQDRRPSILTEVVQSTKYICLRYSVKLTTNNNDNRLINRQKINVAAASDPRQDWSLFPFALPLSSPPFLTLLALIAIMYMRIKSLCILYHSSGPAFVSWRLDAALRLDEIYK